MTYQLRSYVVKPGKMDEWLTEWREKVVPLRLKFGFEIVGAWVIEEEDRFVWIVAHDGDFAAGTRPTRHRRRERPSLPIRPGTSTTSPPR